MNNSQFENKPVQSTKLWRDFFKLFMPIVQSTKSSYHNLEKGWKLMTCTCFLTKWKISVLTRTLIEFTLLLIPQSYTEDYQQEKNPNDNSPFFIYMWYALLFRFVAFCLTFGCCSSIYCQMPIFSICPFSTRNSNCICKHYFIQL